MISFCEIASFLLIESFVAHLKAARLDDLSQPPESGTTNGMTNDFILSGRLSLRQE
jgi:hypothetical protein